METNMETNIICTKCGEEINLEKLSDSVTELDLRVIQRGKLIYYIRFMLSPDNISKVFNKLYGYVRELHKEEDFF